MGGAVDFNAEDHLKAWQHWPQWAALGFEPYCPKCECAGLTDDQVINQNYWKLRYAQVCILDLRKRSIGTPIELYWRVWQQRKSAILIAEPGSVFIRYSVQQFGAILVETPEEALSYLIRRSV